jgi:hypothetical protein
VRVDQPRHYEEARAVDLLRAFGDVGDEAAAGDGDVGASELTRADVDETVAENELRQAPASEPTSDTASVGIASSGTVFAKPSQVRTRLVPRTRATRPT